jgi:type VI secretion system protein VasD
MHGDQMMTRRDRFCLLVAGAFAGLLVMSACASSPPKPARTRLTIAATPDTNPDATGRPSPVVVRVYQLKADTAFTGADFFALYDDEMKVLGAELIGRNEYVLAPSERRTLELDVSADARFVGIVAAYRDIRNAQWRTVVQAPLRRDEVTINVERARVAFSDRD